MIWYTHVGDEGHIGGLMRGSLCNEEKRINAVVREMLIIQPLLHFFSKVSFDWSVVTQ